MPATPFSTDPNPANRPGVWGEVDRGIATLDTAVKGYGELLKPELMQQIGSALGGLNGIGALRSGASQVALNDIGTNYSDRVGSYAATTASQGADLGLNVKNYLQNAKNQRDQKRAALLGSIGSVLGAGIGFLAGPAGAALGADAAGKLAGKQ
jgi:hypothetical protein